MSLAVESERNSLEMRLNREIPEGDDELLAHMLNNSWGWLFNTTPEIMRGRLRSDSLIIAAYDEKKENECLEGFDLSTYDGEKLPIVLLETLAIRTYGDPSNIPKNYFELTNFGMWKNPEEKPDTIMMVDLTALPSRRGRNGNGEVGRVIKFAKDLFSGRTDYELGFDPSDIPKILTYTPDVGPVKRMHMRYGATDTEFKIPNARSALEGFEYLGVLDPPNEEMKHVNIMSYME